MKYVVIFMAEQGLVLSATADELTILLERTEACAKCRACIAGMQKNEMVLTAKNLCRAQTNDIVMVDLNPRLAFQAVMLMYGVPLLFLLVGIGAGYGLASALGASAARDGIAFGLGIVGLVLSYLFIRNWDKRMDKTVYTPVATAIVCRAETETT